MAVVLRGQDRDVSGGLSQAVVLDKNLTKGGPGLLLVPAGHRCSGVHDVAQGRVIMVINRLIIYQTLEDRRDREHVDYTLGLDQFPDFCWSQAVGKWDDRRC